MASCSTVEKVNPLEPKREATSSRGDPDRPLTVALVDPLLHPIEAYRLRWEAVQR
jgi:hypothetical protein